MARTAGGDAALIEAKAVESSWPRIGSAVFAPPMSVEDALGEREGVFGAAVEDALLTRLNLKLGDVIRIGEASFALRTILASEPDRLATGVGLGPRALISQDGSRRNQTHSAGIAGPMDDTRRHGRAKRRAGQRSRPDLHGSGQEDFP